MVRSVLWHCLMLEWRGVCKTVRFRYLLILIFVKTTMPNESAKPHTMHTVCAHLITFAAKRHLCGCCYDSHIRRERAPGKGAATDLLCVVKIMHIFNNSFIFQVPLRSCEARLSDTHAMHWDVCPEGTVNVRQHKNKVMLCMSFMLSADIVIFIRKPHSYGSSKCEIWKAAFLTSIKQTDTYTGVIQVQ